MSIETSPGDAEAPSAGVEPDKGARNEEAGAGQQNAGEQKATRRKKAGKEEAAVEEPKGPYPWGSKEPAKRVADLEKAFEAFEKRRADETEAWAARQAQFTAEEKQLKADLKAARAILEKSKREAAARTVAQSVERLLASGKIDTSVLDDEGALEKLLLGALAAKA